MNPPPCAHWGSRERQEDGRADLARCHPQGNPRPAVLARWQAAEYCARRRLASGSAASRAERMDAGAAMGYVPLRWHDTADITRVRLAFEGVAVLGWRKLQLCEFPQRSIGRIRPHCHDSSSNNNINTDIPTSQHKHR